MPKTFAFSNKGNHWKTRYSFYPSQYDWVDSTFISFPPEVTNPVVTSEGRTHAYRHGYGANCTFYGQTTNSGISISFNDNVSNNKMYRSFSVEGTSNIVNNALNIFSVNNSNVPNQATQSVVSALDERGGIMYGSVGYRNQNSAKNVSVLGSVIAVTAEYPQEDAPEGETLDVPITIYLNWSYGGQSNITPDAQLFFLNPNGNANNLIGTYFTMQEGVDPAIDQADSMPVRPVNGVFFGPNYITATIETTLTTAAEVETLMNAVLATVETAGLSLFSVTPTETNGSMPQGQYADLVMTLGAGDYEIYAFNAYYEPNSLDHSK